MDWVVSYLLDMGVKKMKIMLGISFYGREFTWESDLKMLGNIKTIAYNF